LLRRGLARQQFETFSLGLDAFPSLLRSVVSNKHFLRHLTTHCEKKSKSLASKIVRLLSESHKRTLLLAGNRKGSWITVKEPEAHGAWKTRYVQTFCPRLFSAIRLPDAVLASRTIIVPLIRTASQDKANADPMVVRDWPFPRALLINDLWALALSCMAELEAHDEYVADHAPLMGRTLEPWRAILGSDKEQRKISVSPLLDQARGSVAQA
jgi:hypothetical protein